MKLNRFCNYFFASMNEYLCVSETGPNRLTVGKIYGGMLILENWKQTRFTAIPAPRKPALVRVAGIAFGWHSLILAFFRTVIQD